MSVTIQCAQCGTQFLADSSRKHSAKFCSQTCNYTYQKIHSKVTLTCACCGISFETYRHRKAQGQKYCSVPCQAKARNHKVALTCHTCGKSYQRKPGKASDSRFCSIPCIGAFTKNKVTKPCLWCGTPYSIAKALDHSSNYCSMKCSTASKVRLSKKTCLYCNKDFYLVPCRKDKFCTAACARKYRLHATHGETDIERAIRWALTTMEIPFMQEHPVKRYMIDFYLPEYSIALEADGVYWHEKNTHDDAERDRELLSMGITTIRITDKELKKKDPIDIIDARLRQVTQYP